MKSSPLVIPKGQWRFARREREGRTLQATAKFISIDAEVQKSMNV